MLEDSVSDAEIIRRFLLKQKPGCRFSIAGNKTSFTEALRQFGPDLILADNALPQFNGLEALQIVRETAGDIPFILVTGSMPDEFAAYIIKSGADDYILKDRLTRLPDAIDAALARRKARKEKQEAMQQLIQSEQRYRGLLESAPDAMVIVNSHGLVQLINAQTESMFGYTGPELIGRHVGILFPEKFGRDGEQMDFDTRWAIQAGKGFEWLGRKKDGLEFPVEMRLSPLETADGPVITAAIRDITERKKAEQALKEMEQEILNQKIEEQKKITRAILKAQEQERNRIGQELHDNINQILAGTKLYLEMARKDDLKVKELIKYSIDLIQNSMDEIRLLSARSVTPLKDINLGKLLQLRVDELNKASGISFHFIYEADNEAIGDDLKLNIYRIVQEQLNNIVRHAAARHAHIRIDSRDERIHILITDDGKGFDIHQSRKGIGISNMTNRVESFNGDIQITTAPGTGCKIEIALPAG
jgi:PAS domain S-box-containing protein